MNPLTEEISAGPHTLVCKSSRGLLVLQETRVKDFLEHLPKAQLEHTNLVFFQKQ